MTRAAFSMLVSAAVIGATGAVLSFLQHQPGLGLAIALGAAAVEITVLRVSSELPYQRRRETRFDKLRQAAAADLRSEQDRFGQIGETLAWEPREKLSSKATEGVEA